jgi:hypothetical protein
MNACEPVADVKKRREIALFENFMVLSGMAAKSQLDDVHLKEMNAKVTHGGCRINVVMCLLA